MHCTARVGIEFTIPQVQIADLTHSLTLQGTGLLKNNKQGNAGTCSTCEYRDTSRRAEIVLLDTYIQFWYPHDRSRKFRCTAVLMVRGAWWDHGIARAARRARRARRADLLYFLKYRLLEI